MPRNFLLLSFLFLLKYLTLVSCSQESIYDVKSKIKKLHDLNINVSTFYELLNVAENATIREIKLNYRKLSRLPNPFSQISDKQYYDILFTGYSLLKDNIKTYEYVLSNSYVFLEENLNISQGNSRCVSLLILVATTCLVVFLMDLIVFLYRYLQYSELSEKKRLRTDSPKMYIYKIFSRSR